jgi:hypothetical protein
MIGPDGNLDPIAVKQRQAELAEERGYRHRGATGLASAVEVVVETMPRV